MLTATSRILAVLALVATVLLSYLSIFGYFSVYDDEGYNVAMIRLVSQGVPLYTDLFAYHGPLPYLVKAAALNILGVAVTHESVRLWVMAVWIFSSAVAAAVIRNMTGNPLFAIGGWITISLHLFPLRFNPGHPEDFVVLLLVLSLLVVTVERQWLSDNIRLCLLGLIAAALIATKVNVGLLYSIALIGWMLASLPRKGPWRISSVLFTMAAIALPGALMHNNWKPEWQLLLISTVVIAITCCAVFLQPVTPTIGFGQVVLCFGSMVGGSILIVAATILTGSRLSDIARGTILTAASHPQAFLRPMSFGILAIPVLGVFACIAALQFGWIARLGTISLKSRSLFKVVLALCAFFATALFNGQYLFALLGPVSWLVLTPAFEITLRNRQARLFLILTAVFQILQIYPVIGSQTAWSSLLLCCCALVLLHDGLAELRHAPKKLPTFAAVATALGSGILVYSLVFFTLDLWNRYSRTPSIGFNNSDRIRIPMATRADFDWIVASTSRYCDQLVTQPGMNSLLLWSNALNRSSPSPLLITGWPLILNDAQESGIVAMLNPAKSVCAVYNQNASDWWTRDGVHLTPLSLAEQPLVKFIQSLPVIRKIGDYEIRGNAVAEAAWKDDYLLNGVRDLARSRAALAVPGDLLAARSGELELEFLASVPGLLISIPSQPDGAEQDIVPMTPVLYISSDGRLIARSGNEDIAIASDLRALDGRWHQLRIRLDAAGCGVAIDQGDEHHIPGMLREGNRTRYIQLGPAYVGQRFRLGQGWIDYHGKFRDVRIEQHPVEQRRFSAALVAGQ